MLTRRTIDAAVRKPPKSATKTKPSTADGRVLRAQGLRDATRAHILRTAGAMFAARGYSEVSIGDIIEAAEIARGTFYLHFETKRALVEELLDTLIAELKRVLVRVDATAAMPPFEQLVGNLERVLEVLDRNADLARLVLLQLGGSDAELHERIEAFNRHTLAMMRASLSAGQALGLVRAIDVDVAAAGAFGSMRETIVRQYLGRRASAEQRRALARKLLDYNLNGLLAADARNVVNGQATSAR